MSTIFTPYGGPACPGRGQPPMGVGVQGVRGDIVCTLCFGVRSLYGGFGLLTEKPTPSGPTYTSKRSFETSIPTKTSCDAIILSPSCDCGREPRQLFGREIRGDAGALLDTGRAPRLLTVAVPPQPGPRPRPALRRALSTKAHRQDCL